MTIIISNLHRWAKWKGPIPLPNVVFSVYNLTTKTFRETTMFKVIKSRLNPDNVCYYAF
jgi:hypothetical protein